MLDLSQLGSIVTEEEAVAIYRRGREAVIFALLELSRRLQISEKKLGCLQAELASVLEEKQRAELSTPSGATPVYKKENASRRGRKKPGRKQGHKGEHRQVPLHIDREESVTVDRCPHCGDLLSESSVSRERIIEDIPDVTPVITRYIIHGGFCKRCQKLVEPPVTAAFPRSTIGLNLVVLTAWLHYGLGTTLHHIREVLNYHLHFQLSAGGLVQIWKRLCDILAVWYEALCEEARASATLHADETGWRVNGVTHWLWCFTNETVVCFLIDRSRGSPALKQFFKEVFAGVLVTDFWRAYGKFTNLRQVCFVHLFRELAKVSEKNGSDEWQSFRKKLVRWMRDAVRLDENEEIAEAGWASRKERLKMRLQGFIGEPFSDKECLRIQKRLKEYQHDLLTFLDHEGVASNNNKAEREIRPAVIIRKNSSQNKSDDGARMQVVLMSIYRTLKLRGHNPMSVIHDALVEYIKTGQLPPMPGPATLAG